MTTINDIEARLNAIAFSGRSYPGSSREEVKAAYNAAVADFEANAAVDVAYLIGRVRELQAAIAVAAAGVADGASYIAARYGRYFAFPLYLMSDKSQTAPSLTR